MRKPLRSVFLGVCLMTIAQLVCMDYARPLSQAQEEAAVDDWQRLVNETRLDEGLDPYARSRLLTEAAQRHAVDLAENGLVSPDDLHLGTDDTELSDRIEAVGYAAWQLGGDRSAVAENVWYGEGDLEEALVSFLADPDDRSHILDDQFRELGVGIAAASSGRQVYVLVFGARPNVLPIFINDGAPRAENPEVAIRLTNERLHPEGQGAGFIGEAVEIRINGEPDFEGLAWRPWAPLVSWTLPDVAGEHTVYVQYRDAAGRTAAATDTIRLIGDDMASPPATSLAETPPPEPTTSEADSSTPEPPGATGIPVSGATAPSATTPPGGSPTPGPVLRATPFPTWTPLPSAEPTRPEPNGDQQVSLSFPDLREYRRALTLAGILQGVVIILGLYSVLHRGNSE